MTTPARILASHADPVVVVKVIGRANFAICCEFKELLTQVHRRGCRRVLIDLAECLLMDSTFLGVLAEAGVRFRSSSAPPEPGIELWNPNPAVLDLLTNLGIIQLFRVQSHSDCPLQASETVPAAETKATRVELARTSLEAHRALMEINPANEAKFKDVARFLAEDLARLEQAGSDEGQAG